MQANNIKVLHLAKENMKFSSAHFLVFDENRAERLHGHNYRVRAAIYLPWIHFSEQAYGVDFSLLKKIIKDHLDQWDEHILLPAARKDMKIQEKGKGLELLFRDREYLFPKDEVVLLPIQNTSVEMLSELLCESLGKAFAPLGIRGLKIQVEETLGQSAESHWGDVGLC